MINFFRYKNFFLVLSLVLIFGSLGSIFFKGFNYGIDFKGGTLIQIFYKDHKIEKNEIEKLKEQFIKNNLKLFVQTFTNDDERILLKISDNQNSLQNNSSENFDFFKKIIINSFENQNIIFEKIEFIGAKTGEKFFFKSSLAVLFAFIGIFIYLLFRFNFSFAISGLIALFHDIIISFGFISLFRIEFNLVFITAILTIIGYSINDSVIIFDRIRELLKTKQANQNNLQEIINIALNNTLKRTIFTSLTTLLSCLALILFGGRDLFSFSIPAFFGICIGTYSSIMIACQFLLFFEKRNFFTINFLKLNKKIN
jgi:preprotein translocase subunit SecF